jgi:hypothetical protein
MKPREESFECYVDADFSGNWNKEEAQWDPDTARSRTGFCIMYCGCPIMWASKLQTEIALSSTEAEYIALSESMRSVLPLMSIVEEMHSYGIKLQVGTPKVYCKVFEDNSGAIELSKVPKIRPRTKHINIKYHHFRHQVERGRVSVHPIKTDDQPADCLTKPLNRTLHERHRFTLMGW